MNHRVNVPTIHNNALGMTEIGAPLAGRALSRPKYWDMTEHVPPFLDRNRDAQKRRAFAARIDHSFL